MSNIRKELSKKRIVKKKFMKDKCCMKNKIKIYHYLAKTWYEKKNIYFTTYFRKNYHPYFINYIK